VTINIESCDSFQDRPSYQVNILAELMMKTK